MGAVPPASPWIPQDDFILKNAVEGGASLESLARGAVQFSRKFSVQELQKRWHALLYDPVISAEAASLMMEFEQATSSSKFSKSGNSKDSKCISVKRRTESVRNCYYMRKRVRSEPCDPVSFLVRTGSDHYLNNGDEPLPEDCMFGNPESSQFELQESSLGNTSHACPEAVGSSSHAFRAHFQDTVPEVCLVKQEGLHIEDIHMVEEFSQPKDLLMNTKLVQEGSKLDGDQVFSSSLPDGNSFQNLEYSTPLSDIPPWRAAEGNSEQRIQVGLGLREKDLHTGDAFLLPVEGIKLEISPQELKNGNACPEGYLSDLLDFPHDEMLLMEGDGKDGIDKFYYDGFSLLLNSPKDVNQGELANMPAPESSQHPIHSKTEPSLFPSKDKENGSHQCGDVHSSEVQVPPILFTPEPQFPEMTDGVICCMLNTEDPIIPCNDHVVFTNLLDPKFSGRGSIQDDGKPKFPSFKEVSVIPNNKEYLTSAQRHLGNPGQYQAASQMMKSQVPSNIGLRHPCGSDFELVGSDTTRKTGGVAYGCSTSNYSGNAGVETMMQARSNENSIVVATKRHLNHNSTGSLFEDPALRTAPCEYYPETNVSGVKQELDNFEQSQRHQVGHAKVGATGTASEQVNHPTSNLEEAEEVESDDELPNFSDIEAMILDMDLDPEDHDLHTNELVLKYQHEDTKKAIMRLDQAAYACRQRAIKTHKAFAVLRGYNSKHYIKKPEVLLGRQTEDVPVDIDLGMEGRANKISRRQAIIKLDGGGSFQLKNLGKFPISVNDTEVACGQIAELASCCFIEIRGMSFVFEVNQTFVKQYLDNTTQIIEMKECKPLKARG